MAILSPRHRAGIASGNLGTPMGHVAASVSKESPWIRRARSPLWFLLGMAVAGTLFTTRSHRDASIPTFLRIGAPWDARKDSSARLGTRLEEPSRREALSVGASGSRIGEHYVSRKAGGSLRLDDGSDNQAEDADVSDTGSTREGFTRTRDAEPDLVPRQQMKDLRLLHREGGEASALGDSDLGLTARADVSERGSHSSLGTEDDRQVGLEKSREGEVVGKAEGEAGLAAQEGLEGLSRESGPGGGVQGGSRVPEKAEAGAEPGFVTRQELAEIAQRVAKQRTVIMTVCNAGYLDFLENWVKFAAKLGLDKHLLVVAEDLETWNFVERFWPGHAVRIHVPEIEAADDVFSYALGLSEAGETGGKESEFNSPKFKKMMYRRVFYIREMLYARVNVLLTDTDIVFLRDPLPFMVPTMYDFMAVPDDPDSSAFEMTYAHSVSARVSLKVLTRLNFCGGFLFLRSTPAAWVMIDLLAMKLFRLMKRTGRENEQTFLPLVMWEALRLNPPARIGVLPQQLFMPGWLFFSDDKYDDWRKRFKRTTDAPPVIIHNNWVTGKQAKIDRFKEKGLWALDDADPKESKAEDAASADLASGDVASADLASADVASADVASADAASSDATSADVASADVARGDAIEQR